MTYDCVTHATGTAWIVASAHLEFITRPRGGEYRVEEAMQFDSRVEARQATFARADGLCEQGIHLSDVERVTARKLGRHVDVLVGDREIDIYEVMSRAQTEPFRLLIRLAHDRSVKTKPDIEKAANGRTDEVTRLYEAVDRLPLGELHQTIDIEAKKETKKRPAQPARTAAVRVRWGKVTIQAPRGAKGSVELSIVNVFEENRLLFGYGCLSHIVPGIYIII